MAAFVVGVDGCRAGWVACRIGDSAGNASIAVYATFQEVLTQEASAQVIAIDIPIGFRNDWTPRACDREAKSLLGPRRSSIFAAPPRCLLALTSYKEANDQSKNAFNRGISQQTFHLFPKIREVDSIIRNSSDLRIHEVHPELAFRKFAGADLLHSKKTTRGYEERSRILSAHGIHLPQPGHWRTALSKSAGKVQRDDLADAAIAAIVSLRILRGEAVSIPAEAEHDELGIPMRMLY